MRLGPLFTWRGEKPRGSGVRTHVMVRRCYECDGILWRSPRSMTGNSISRHHRCVEALIAAKWPHLDCFVCGRSLA